MAAPQPPGADLFPATGTLHGVLQRSWRQRGPLAWALWPLSQVYRLLVALRRTLYRTGLLRSDHPGRPVVVVGNAIAGGAGKTPVVIATVQHLQAHGWRPGVISRGYGRSTRDCRTVQPDSQSGEVGDEPLLIARTCAVPVVVAVQRIDAARSLLARHPEVDIIVCDDGLQHWALARDVDICVFNDQGTGNGFLLPAGPLREPWPRTACWGTPWPRAIDLVLHAGPAPRGAAPAFALQRRLSDHALRSDGTRVPLQQLCGQPVQALAAIARPDDFFAMLRAQGLELAECIALPDHFDFDSWKRPPNKGYTMICTEKDAVKLWQHHPDALAVPLQVQIDARFFTALDALLAPTRLSSAP